MDKKKIESILETFKDLETKLNNMNSQDFNEYAKLSKEYSNMKPVVEKSSEFIKLQNDFFINKFLNKFLYKIFNVF